MTNKKFNNLFGQRPRDAQNENNSIYMDIVPSIQKVNQEIMINLCPFVKNMVLKI